MRVLAWVASGLVLGALVRPWHPGADLAVAIVAMVAASCLAAASAIRRPFARLAAALALGLLAVASGAVLAREPARRPLPSGVARLSGMVESSDADDRGPRVVLRVTGGTYLGAGALPRGALVTLRGVDAARGDTVTLVAVSEVGSATR